MFKVAIVGCPNVGKSTLFNQLLRRHQAVTHDEPGVTRDYNEGICKAGDTNIIAIDSPGWGHKDEFSIQVQENIVNVLRISNLIILLVDPEISPKDREFSLWLRKNTDLPVMLIINKCKKEDEINAYATELGWKHIVNISAKNCIGLSTLRHEIATYIKHKEESIEGDFKISIVGRPNVGKSTFINQLLRDNRVITSPIAGTTRDAIAVHWKYKKQHITLVDTAGMRRKSKINETVEFSSVGLSVHSIRQADVTILILDATRGFEHQDMSIADVIIREGKPLVIAVNKCDMSSQEEIEHIKYCCSHKFPYGISIVTISALENKRCSKVIDACIENHKVSKQTISTAKLNKWLSSATKKHEPPLSKRKTALRLKFIAQTGTEPFTFKIVANIPEDISKSYIRYLINDLRQRFNLRGMPINIVLEKNHNPYIKKQKS